ncbi:MAG: hypothetical protein HC913_13855 [Microscillaceae bacterium]|nr:hypothetical protein [Microscillaceae bacterium]
MNLPISSGNERTAIQFGGWKKNKEGLAYPITGASANPEIFFQFKTLDLTTE